MATTAQKRLTQDFRKLKADPPPGVSAEPSDETILRWNAIVFGPYNTPFENGVFKLTLYFTEDYPLKAPKVVFDNPGQVFHPNVYICGNICLDVLQSKWNSIYDTSNILTAIQALLSNPNPDSPANRDAAILYKTDPPAYDKKVRECIVQFNG